ncbi:hypothetical protein [Mangrovicoccus ximenensis]|uniref:hypothetical protein n=1 Tax=Mangrovicoccus ximenensis TaxID=1911570 RepID=UPI000D362A04|nr:hypothetical protein [Mangrovicoccus ximenensis]
MPIPYEIPLELAGAMASGKAQLFGAIIKDSATGQILGHVQQTGLVDQVARHGLQGLGTAATGGFSPLGVLHAAQSFRIQQALGELQQGMHLLQVLDIGNLVVSGLGLGVSVVGFERVLRQLRAIRDHLGTLGEAIRQVTADRRQDELETLFATIEADVDGVRYLSDHPDPGARADALHHDLLRAARRLEAMLIARLDGRMATADARTAFLDELWTLSAALRLCQDTALRALFLGDRLAIAAHVAADEAQRMIGLFGRISPDLLSRSAHAEEGWEAWKSSRGSAQEAAVRISSGVRSGAVALAGQASLASCLGQQGAQGRAFLERAEREQELACLFVPASAA